jgi:galactitol-specific phosphotransferase system IIB component
LLDFIAKYSQASSCVKWMVSSQNWQSIEAQLSDIKDKVCLNLELNENSVTAAVSIFIRQKVDQLAQEQKYDEELRSAVINQLGAKANGTFLWVALVCQELRKIPKSHALEMLALFPKEMDELFDMMKRISESDLFFSTIEA